METTTGLRVWNLFATPASFFEQVIYPLNVLGSYLYSKEKWPFFKDGCEDCKGYFSVPTTVLGSINASLVPSNKYFWIYSWTMIKFSDKGNNICKSRYEIKGLFKERWVQMKFRISNMGSREDKAANRLRPDWETYTLTWREWII